MINAIYKGKAGHWLKGVDEDTHWRSSIPTYEDYLTSAFFEIYFKLPLEALETINQRLFSSLQDKFSFLHRDNTFTYEFWPRFNAVGHSFVEPDIIVVSENLKQILVIEAKTDYAFQSLDQLTEQYEVVRQHYGNAYSVWVLAIGGERSFPEVGAHYSHVKWRKVFDILTEVHLPHRYAADISILRDAFGFRTLNYTSLSSISDWPLTNLVWPIWKQEETTLKYLYDDKLLRNLEGLWT